MIFLPIVERELRVAARRSSTHWVRAGFALGSIFIGVLVYLASWKSSAHQFATNLFAALVFLSIFYCLVSGVRWTADCLSGEKREGTLGLLFLTDLKGHDIVFGKLAATSLNGFYGLLAMVPVLAVPLLLGGLTHGEFWRLVLVLVNTFLFSLAIGIFVSAVIQDARRAFGANFLLLLLVSAVPPACAGAIAYFSSTPRIIAPLFYSCPAYSLYLSYDQHYRFSVGHFWSSIALIHAVTWLLVGLACWLVPRSWQDQSGEAGVIRWRDRWRLLVYGQAAKRKVFRKRLLDINAFYWLASRAWVKPAMVWICLAAVGLWWIFVWLRLQYSWFEESFAFTTTLLQSTLLKLWIAIEAGQRLAD